MLVHQYVSLLAELSIENKLLTKDVMTRQLVAGASQLNSALFILHVHSWAWFASDFEVRMN